jgi:hypothetical protein
MNWKLLLVTGKMIEVEATWLVTTAHGITAKDAEGNIILSLPARMVLLIQREGVVVSATDAELVEAWETAKPPSP